MWQDDRIQAALDGQNPMVMAELPGGFAVFGDVQFLPGYSVLLPKREVGSLNELSKREQSLFLQSMATLGDAILTACEPLRVNYDILGNTDHFYMPMSSRATSRRCRNVWPSQYGCMPRVIGVILSTNMSPASMMRSVSALPPL